MVKNGPFWPPEGGHTPPEGGHTLLNLGVGLPLEPESELFRLFRVSTFFGNVQTSFAEICTNLFWQFLRDYFVKDLWKICSRDFTETLMTNWSMARSTLRDYFVEDFVEDFVQDLIGDRSTTHRLLCERFVEDTFDKNIWETPENKKIYAMRWRKNIHTMCEISANAD